MNLSTPSEGFYEAADVVVAAKFD